MEPAPGMHAEPIALAVQSRHVPAEPHESLVLPGSHVPPEPLQLSVHPGPPLPQVTWQMTFGPHVVVSGQSSVDVQPHCPPPATGSQACPVLAFVHAVQTPPRLPQSVSLV